MHRTMSVRVIAIFSDTHKKLCLYFDDKNIAMYSCVCVCVPRGGGIGARAIKCSRDRR